MRGSCFTVLNSRVGLIWWFGEGFWPFSFNENMDRKRSFSETNLKNSEKQDFERATLMDSVRSSTLNAAEKKHIGNSGDDSGGSTR